MNIFLSLQVKFEDSELRVKWEDVWSNEENELPHKIRSKLVSANPYITSLHFSVIVIKTKENMDMTRKLYVGVLKCEVEKYDMFIRILAPNDLSPICT